MDLKNISQEKLAEIVSKVAFEVLNQLNPKVEKSNCTQIKEAQCKGCGYCVNDNTESVKNLINQGATRIASSYGISNVNSELAQYIDHTSLKPDVTKDDIIKLCEEAKKYRFKAVCVNPIYVRLCSEILMNSGVLIAAVVGFPLGASSPEIKADETRSAVEDGAREIDMVINIGALKDKDYELIFREIHEIVIAASGYPVKVIIETALLDDTQKIIACALAKAAGAHFVKTSTGFGPGGATVEDVALMRKIVGPYMGVKASGGIRDTETAQKMISAGANRIGASASVKIIQKG
jgi:deoxyribose-phosphate aldolase